MDRATFIVPAEKLISPHLRANSSFCRMPVDAAMNTRVLSRIISPSKRILISMFPTAHSNPAQEDVPFYVQLRCLEFDRSFRFVCADRCSFHRLFSPASETAKYPNASCELFVLRSRFA